MTRDFKAGDVAMVSALDKPKPYRAYFDGETWREYDAKWFCVDSPASHRPLVVIDPEDREQVERLTRAHCAAFDSTCVQPEEVNAMQAALRSLIAPPRPPEPTGLGAVVEDAEGVRWLRRHMGEQSVWCHARETGWHEWSEITAARVLSEGVTA
ncbi:MAG: hypothetical protein ACXVGA_06805 [Mycobacteriaceae bacterium]